MHKQLHPFLAPAVAASLASVALMILFAGCATPADPASRGGQAVVAFVKPETFTDLRQSNAGLAPSQAPLLAEVERCLTQAARRYLPATNALEVRILDLDQAGWISPRSVREVRVVRSSQPARASLDYTLKTIDGSVLKTGHEDLVEFPDAFRDASSSGEVAPVVTRMLEGWVRQLARQVEKTKR